MEEEQSIRGGIGALLEELRREKGYTRLSLAEASGVSATYIGMIQGGIDSRTGKEIRPSPDTLRKLAGALARGDEWESRRLYKALMGSLDYLPGEDAAAAAEPETAAVALRDPRLLGPFRSVMLEWESLPTDEQAAVLTLFKLIDQNRRHR